jgi:O-antigen ligase
VVLPLVLLALWLNRGRNPIRTPKLTQALAASLVLVMVMAILAVNSTVLERVHKISNEVQLYQRGVIENSSIGSRIAMWKAASQMVREHPIFGVGAHQFYPELKRLQDQGDYPRDAKLYRHAHNTYLNVAAEYGLIGLSVMLVALAALLKLCLSMPPGLKSLALLIMASWMLMALSNDVFAHQNLMRVMSLGFAVCIGVGLRQQRTGADVNRP